jgi:hypothetical protein
VKLVVSNKFRIVKKCLLLTLIALQSGCVFFGIRSADEPDYQLLQKEDDFEVRQYAPMVVATTEVNADFGDAGQIAFKRLFGYISGENSQQEEMAMTIPVIAKSSEKGWVFSFVLPREYQIDTAPKPLNLDVDVVQLTAKKVAVMRFSGTWSETPLKEKSTELSAWIVENKMTTLSEPSLATYDPPFALPFLRRNEVMITVGDQSL